MSYELRLIENALYRLKRAFGQPIEVVWTVSYTTNDETGKPTVVYDSASVKRAIVLPDKLSTDFAYDLTFIASNKNFTYGGLFDVNRRRVVIHRKELPADFRIDTVGYWLVIKGKRYDIETVESFDNDAGYAIVAKQAEQVDLANLIKRALFSWISFEQTVEVTKE